MSPKKMPQTFPLPIQIHPLLYTLSLLQNTPPPTHQTPTPIHPSTNPTLDSVHHSSDPIPDPVHPSNEQDSDRESLNGGFNESDVDDELRSFREERSKRKRMKKRERALLPDHVKLGTEKKKRPDAGYDESIGANRNNLEGKLACDEPYYPSDEATSFETDPDASSDEEEKVQQRERELSQEGEKRIWDFTLGLRRKEKRKEEGKKGKFIKVDQGSWCFAKDLLLSGSFRVKFLGTFDGYLYLKVIWKKVSSLGDLGLENEEEISSDEIKEWQRVERLMPRFEHFSFASWS
uniref:Uncharacterized protein n=1 Tax=Solanum tuberosum TaxID=4113 RepID=M1AEV0_SOLTU